MAPDDRNPRWLTALGLAVPVLSAVVVAIIANRTNLRVAELAGASKAAEIATQQTKLANEQEMKKAEFLEKHLPRLLGDNANERITSQVLLSLTYPNDAPEIVSRLQVALGAAAPASLSVVKKAADSVRTATGDWAVVVSTDRDVPGANDEVRRATSNNLNPATIFKRGAVYLTVVGRYPSRELADQAAISIRSVFRPDAYPVSLGAFCRQPTDTTLAGSPVTICR